MPFVSEHYGGWRLDDLIITSRRIFQEFSYFQANPPGGDVLDKEVLLEALAIYSSLFSIEIPIDSRLFQACNVII
jgi:hypothetical protein